MCLLPHVGLTLASSPTCRFWIMIYRTGAVTQPFGSTLVTVILIRFLLFFQRLISAHHQSSYAACIVLNPRAIRSARRQSSQNNDDAFRATPSELLSASGKRTSGGTDSGYKWSWCYTPLADSNSRFTRLNFSSCVTNHASFTHDKTSASDQPESAAPSVKFLACSETRSKLGGRGMIISRLARSQSRRHHYRVRARSHNPASRRPRAPGRASLPAPSDSLPVAR
jgi:hypothetical protein